MSFIINNINELVQQARIIHQSYIENNNNNVTQIIQGTEVHSEVIEIPRIRNGMHQSFRSQLERMKWLTMRICILWYKLTKELEILAWDSEDPERELFPSPLCTTKKAKEILFWNTKLYKEVMTSEEWINFSEFIFYEIESYNTQQRTNITQIYHNIKPIRFIAEAIANL